MRTAFVSPTNLLRETLPYSKYHLALTHKVVYERAYCDFYAERSKAGDFIILDNSAVEKKGRSVPLKEVVLAAVLIKPAVVVLPDILFDSEKTLDELENSLKSPQLRFLRRAVPDIKLAAVVQGVDVHEWLECFDILNNPKNGIDMLGIPKISSYVFGTRVAALESIKKRVKKPCHLLGVWHESNTDEIAAESMYDFVIGIDTPKPVKLAVQGKTLDCWSDLVRDSTFVDRSHEVDLDLLHRNCTDFKDLCKGNGKVYFK